MIAETTTHLGLQLPHPANELDDDVFRLRAAIIDIDAKFAQLDALLASDDINLDSLQELVAAIKGDAANLLAHVGAGGVAHQAATSSLAGFMSAADKSKLDGVSLGLPVSTVTINASALGQTSFVVPGGYTAGAVDVLLDGIELDADDYEATDGSTVILAEGVQSVTSRLKVRKYKQSLSA